MPLFQWPNERLILLPLAQAYFSHAVHELCYGLVAEVRWIQLDHILKIKSWIFPCWSLVAGHHTGRGPWNWHWNARCCQSDAITSCFGKLENWHWDQHKKWWASSLLVTTPSDLKKCLDQRVQCGQALSVMESITIQPELWDQRHRFPVAVSFWH